MDIKVIVEKALKGEDYKADINALPEAERAGALVELSKELDKTADERLQKNIALQQSKNIITPLFQE